MRTTKAVIGRWDEIFQYFGLPPITNGKHFKGPCPMCNKKSKFRIDNKNGSGTWICVCGSGNGWKLLEEHTGQDRKELYSIVDEIIGNDSSDDDSIQPPSQQEQISKDFSKMKSIKGSPAELYLINRNITVLPMHSVRFSNSQFYDRGMPYMTAMFALATSNANRIVYTHCTYLVGDRKVTLDPDKKMKGITQYDGSVAVRMFPYKDRLGIAEGIETALSTTQLYNIPTWSCVNSNLMKKFVVPENIKILDIFADNDRNGTGLAAAFHTGRKNILKKNSLLKVNIHWPIQIGDFNDIIKDDAPQVMTWTLTK